MSRRLLLPVALGLLLLGGIPALADANGSTETTTETRSCSAPADDHYSAPTDTDCRNADGSFDADKTYQATRWTNDVRCGGTNSPTPANPTGLRAYASQAGGIGICSDGALPVQGRAGASGGADGGTVTIDGDKDNAAPNGNETARGWATVGVKPGAAPVVTCGDEYSQGGRADSDSAQARDTQAECGG
jgi:hypothetical protein